MKRIFIAGLFVTGISLIVTAISAWLAPDLLIHLPGGVVALFAGIFLAISGLFGGKLTEWADTIFGKKKEDKPDSTTNNIDQQVNVDTMSGGVIAKEYHHHEPPTAEQEFHDTIGFIPPAKAETYVHRGNIEDEVIAYIREGGKGAIIGVHAPGGLGKTELAKQAAEELKEEFNILWVDVGEKKPIQVVGELLTMCGVQTQPGDTYERNVNAIHHVYQTQRFLVILDDVRKESLENLKDLLPPSPNAALVTNRIQ
jgi:hypothetical protein